MIILEKRLVDNIRNYFLILFFVLASCHAMGENVYRSNMYLEATLIQKKPKLLIELSLINKTGKDYFINKRMIVNDKNSVLSNSGLGEIYFDISTDKKDSILMTAFIEVGYLKKSNYLLLRNGEKYTVRVDISKYYLIDNKTFIEDFNDKIYLKVVYVNKNNGEEFDLKNVYIGEVTSNILELN
jgi:hypothetical protein